MGRIIGIEREFEQYASNGWECYRPTGRIKLVVEFVDSENLLYTTHIFEVVKWESR